MKTLDIIGSLNTTLLNKRELSILNGLVLYLELDNASGDAIDVSGNGNDGTIAGATRTLGKKGRALDFDGSNDYITCGTVASLKVTQWTILLWVKPDGYIAPGNEGAKVVCRSDASNYDLWFNISDTGKLETGFKASIGGYKSTVSRAGVSLGEWTFIASMFDGTYLKLYRNSIRLPTVTTPDYSAFTPNTSDIPFWIGRLFNIYGFDGIMDEIMVYNRALSEAEIVKLYLRYR